MTNAPSDWGPFSPENAIGDPGRQPEINAVAGPLTVGVPDTALDFLSLDDFEVRGCSTRGWSHRYQGTPRQDAFSLLITDAIIVIAVADGVSEGVYSHVAADTAARSACKLAADQFGKNGVLDWLQLARRVSLRVIEEAEYRQISNPNAPDPSIDARLKACLDNMSTTLIVGVVQRTPQPDGFHVDLGVIAGDSVAYLLEAGGVAPVSVGGGKSGTGPITSTRVRPLPGPVDPEVVSVVLNPGDALILGTDGIGDPIGDGDGEVGREFARRWARPPDVARFLLDLNVYRRSYDDDRTAVGLWVRPDVELPTNLDLPVSTETGEESPERPPLVVGTSPDAPAASEAADPPGRQAGDSDPESAPVLDAGMPAETQAVPDAAAPDGTSDGQSQTPSAPH